MLSERMSFDEQKNTPDKISDADFQKAVEKGKVKKVEEMIRKGANVNAEVNGETPLISALSALCSSSAVADDINFITIITLLIENGANPDQYEEESPLSLAIRSGNGTIVKLLLPLTRKEDIFINEWHGKNCEFWGPWYCALLFDASKKYSKIDLLLQLKANGADFNAKDPVHKTLLHHAVGALLVEVDYIKFLLDNGASPCLTDLNLKTPLHTWFSEMGTPHYFDDRFERVIRLFLNHGADINAKDKNASTPLHYAAARGLAKAAETLICCGAEVSAVNQNGLTPLALLESLTDDHKRTQPIFESDLKRDERYLKTREMLLKHILFKQNEQLSSLKNACLHHFFQQPKSREKALLALEKNPFPDVQELITSYQFNP